MEKVCLVLEGGGNRGVYTSGVLDAFIDNDIDIKNIYGVSAGALNAMSYLSKQKGRSLVVSKQSISSKECVDYKRLFLGKSVVDLDYLFDSSNSGLDELNMEEFNKRGEFIVVATNVVTGAPVYKKIEDYATDWIYIKASASLPVLSKIVSMDGLKLLDGGISDSIPVLKAINDGYTKVIVVMTRDKDYVCKPYKFMKAYKTKYIKYPNFIKTMENRADKYNVTRDLIETWTSEGKVLPIYPSEPLVISRLEKDSSKIDYVYNLGYQDGLKMLSEIKVFIGGEINEQEETRKKRKI